MGIRIIIIALVIAGCSSSSPAKPDAMKDAKAADAYFTNCGKPGDVGNNLGIGTFCASLSDCSNTVGAPLCSDLGDPTTHFCTTTCSATGSAGQCGDATGTGSATCTCNATNQCGCTPNSCLN